MREKDIDLANTRTFVTLSFSITSTWWHTVTTVYWRSQKKPLKTHRFLQRLTSEMTNIHLFAKLKPQYRTSLSSFPFRHYPKTSFTIVTDTPENLRLKQQSMLNSQVRLRQIPPRLRPLLSLLHAFCFASPAGDTRPNLVASRWLAVSFSLLSVASSQPPGLSASQQETRTRLSWLFDSSDWINEPLWANADTRAR